MKLRMLLTLVALRRRLILFYLKSNGWGMSWTSYNDPLSVWAAREDCFAIPIVSFREARGLVFASKRGILPEDELEVGLIIG